VAVLLKLFISLFYWQLPIPFIPITGFHGTGIKEAHINIEVFYDDVRSHVLVLGLCGKLGN